MKVVISNDWLNFVVGTDAEMDYISNACGEGLNVRVVVNGLKVSGDKAKMYELLLAVCVKYDVDLV